MEHDTRKMDKKNRRLRQDLKVRSRQTIPAEVSMFGSDPAIYYIQNSGHGQRLSRRLPNERQLQRRDFKNIHHIN